MTVDHIVGKPQGLADHAHFVLEEQFDGLDQLELQVVGQTAYVVVGLDAVALENVGVDGTLRQEGYAFLLAGFFLEDADEFRADDFAFLLGVGDARQLIQKAVHCVHVHQVGVHLVAEYFDDLFGLAFAQQAVIDVYAHEVPTDGFDEQGRHDGRIHAARKGQQHFFVADLGADGVYLLGDKGLCESGGGNALHFFGSDVGIHSKLLLCISKLYARRRMLSIICR